MRPSRTARAFAATEPRCAATTGRGWTIALPAGDRRPVIELDLLSPVPGASSMTRRWSPRSPRRPRGVDYGAVSVANGGRHCVDASVDDCRWNAALAQPTAVRRSTVLAPRGRNGLFKAPMPCLRVSMETQGRSSAAPNQRALRTTGSLSCASVLRSVASACSRSSSRVRPQESAIELIAARTPETAEAVAGSAPSVPRTPRRSRRKYARRIARLWCPN